VSCKWTRVNAWRYILNWPARGIIHPQLSQHERRNATKETSVRSTEGRVAYGATAARRQGIAASVVAKIWCVEQKRNIECFVGQLHYTLCAVVGWLQRHDTISGCTCTSWVARPLLSKETLVGDLQQVPHTTAVSTYIPNPTYIKHSSTVALREFQRRILKVKQRGRQDCLACYFRHCSYILATLLLVASWKNYLGFTLRSTDM